MLGDRIRKLRKERKLTLEVLAGSELTKGMVSLIENNKAKPSMESLSYIAKRLGVEVGDLLGEVSVQELRSVLEEAERLFNSESEILNKNYGQLVSLIEPYVDNLTKGYEAARLLEIYSISLYREKIDGWKKSTDLAAQLYDRMNLTSNRASIGIFRSMSKFASHDYAQSLQIFQKERRDLETNHAYIDPMTRLNLDYHEAILYFAVGDSKSATRVMEDAFSFSKENRIFYRIDDLYRLAAAHAMMILDEEKIDLYKKKLKQYSEFADDNESFMFHELMTIMSHISLQKYDQALEIIDSYMSDAEVATYSPWLTLEKGKVLYYLGRNEEALQFLEKVEIPFYIHHPFDLSFFYITESYKALCYFELGDQKEAIFTAIKAVDQYEPLPPSIFKNFSKQTYEKIKGGL
ncbi:helix-turn-helix transcriptional regulator [Litchfieldia alkalitelluris]|uniref:helix-turn-helix transcriptional regulator n=1 Tax=Litchfieldia alkalitelluris TaxID=304268 RepID=UPI00099787C9|nr:helix-turn-helix transcriptional regulator [Litchfieldia alkalitelluris]